MKTTHPCDGPLPAVFFGPPRRHHRQILRGKDYIVFDGELDALTWMARRGEIRENLERRAVRLAAVPLARELSGS